MKTFNFLIIFSSAFIFYSCSKKSNAALFKDLRIEINTSVIYTDLMDELVITVYDNENNNVTSESQILVDNNPINGNRFKTAEARTFYVKAKLNGKESDALTFRAVRHEVNNFSRKIILEEFAGMWCSFCTRFTYLVDTIVHSNNKIIQVQVHSGDILEFKFVQQMRNKFGVGSFPFGYLNRGRVWDESMVMVQNELNRKSKLGLAINTTLSGTSINAVVKVKFDVTTSEKLSIVVLLLEDSLVYPQSNFYNTVFDSPFYGLGDPILDYRHNNVLRNAATDIFGDIIPYTVQNKNEIYEKTFTFNNSGYNFANSKIVAFVQYAENNVSRWGVLNAQVVKSGSSIGFD